MVQPGQKIIVHTGVYREHLQPRQGGTATNRMVCLAAAPGADVVVSGAEPLRGLWHRPRVPGAADAVGRPTTDGQLVATSQKTMVIDLDPIHLTDDQQNWQTKNVTAKDYRLMPWMEPVAEMTPFTSRRGMLFQGDQRLLQMHDAGAVNQVPGSFLISDDGSQVLIHPFNEKIDETAFELAIRPFCLAPTHPSVHFFSIQGIHFTRCANSFLRTGAAAVCNRGGSYWRIEHCHISQCNSAGLECSDVACEALATDHPQRDYKGAGHNILAHNTIESCGTAGIRSLSVKNGWVCQNHIFNCGWQEAEYYYECAGIKLLVSESTLVSGNHIHDITGGCGIWIDWNNKNSQVTGNLICHIDSMQGGIFMEASDHPNQVNGNIVWDCSGFGIFGGDSSNQHYENNLIAHCQQAAIKLICHTDRRLNNQPVSCINNHVTSNVFYKCATHDVEAVPNFFRDNTYIGDNADSLNEQEDFDSGSEWMNGKLTIRDDCLHWSLTSEPQAAFLQQREGSCRLVDFLQKQPAT